VRIFVADSKELQRAGFILMLKQQTSAVDTVYHQGDGQYCCIPSLDVHIKTLFQLGYVFIKGKLQITAVNTFSIGPLHLECSMFWNLPHCSDPSILSSLLACLHSLCCKSRSIGFWILHHKLYGKPSGNWSNRNSLARELVQ